MPSSAGRSWHAPGSRARSNKEEVSMRTGNAAIVLAAALGVGAAAPATAAQGDAWPARPVRIIVPYAPGGATDITARHVANRLHELTGQPIVVDNRAGASGIIAIDLAAKSTADGYTLFVGNVSTNAINETTFASRFKVKPSQALTGVTNLIELPHMFVANGTVPASNMRDFVAWAKKQPAGKVTYGSSGVGSYPHLDGVRLAQAGGFQATHVPYKGGAAQMLPGIASGEVHYMLINLASGLS